MADMDAGVWRRSRSYTLAILLAIYILNIVDRTILSILQEPIKHEFHLADWQLGLMTGFAFALVYALGGVPVARLADRGVPRTAIITVAVVCWSAMTALCGLTQTYLQMLAARFGVGIGEAGATSPSVSLIADHYAHRERGRAMAIYALGGPIGAALGLAVGGHVAQVYGWRIALMVVGLPGLLLAALFRLTVREPPRGLAEGHQATAAPRHSFLEVVTTLARKPTYLALACGGSSAAFTTLGLQYWFPSFFVRSFGMTLTQVGLVWGLSAGAAGVIGTFSGGWLADRFGRRSPRAILMVPAVGMALALPFHLLAVTSGNWVVALVALLAPTALNVLWIAPNMMLTQGLAPVSMRVTSSAISTLVINLIGLGVGPVALGLTSDLFTGMAGDPEVGLRHALMAISPIYLVSAGCFYLASRTVAHDLEEHALQPDTGTAAA